jgi:hypothetical protein
VTPAEVTTSTNTIKVLSGISTSGTGLGLTEAGAEVYSKEGVDNQLIFDEAPQDNAIVACGGISAGTKVKGMRFEDLFMKMLFPHQNPTIGTITAVDSIGDKEWNSTVTVSKVTVPVTKKTLPISQVKITVNGLSFVKTEGVSAGGNIVFEGELKTSDDKPITIKNSSQRITAEAWDSANNKVTNYSGYWTFTKPYFYGVCNFSDTLNAELVTNGIADGTITKVKEGLGSERSKSVTGEQKCIVLIVPSTLSYIRNDLNQGMTSTFYCNEAGNGPKQITLPINGENVTYYVYRNEPSSFSNFTIKFKA